MLYYLFMIKSILIFLIGILIIQALPSQTPIIGIYTESITINSDGQYLFEELTSSSTSFIAASYVKYIQMSGAQVVPIFAYTNDKNYFDKLLPKLNGILFPGGAISINIDNLWTQNADYILKYAINQNKKGNVFPVWGTCLGWQLLAYLTSGYDKKVISPVRGEDAVINKISIKSPSYLFDDLPTNIQNKLQNGQGIVYFHHSFGVLAATYQNTEKLRQFWNIASTTTSSYNQVFISTAEAKDYPIYGTQFHPQKNLYEWVVKADRSAQGAIIAQILSNKFIQKARKSSNKLQGIQYTKISIYNYKAIVPKVGYSQIYVFNEPNMLAQNKLLQSQ